MKIILPSKAESLSENNKIILTWYNLLNNIVNRILGNQDAYLGGVISNNITSVSNSGASATDLMSYELGGGALKTTGDYIEIEASGTFAANANTKAISLVFGSQTIFSISATAINSGSFSLRAKIIRNSDSTQVIIVEGNGTNSVLIKTVDTDGTQDLTDNITIKMIGTGQASYDITQKNLLIKIYIQ